MGNVVTIGGAKPSASSMISRILSEGRTAPASSGNRVFRRGRGLAPEERQLLELARAECEAWLTPASAADIGAAVAPIVASMPSALAGEAMSLRVAAYRHGLAGLPKAALDLARDQVLAGEVEDLSARFAPTPPELARLARNAAAVWQSRLRSIEELLTMREEAPRPPPVSGIHPTAVERTLAAFVEGGTDAARERAERIAADLASRNFPPAPSHVVEGGHVDELQAPLEAEAGKGVA
jgi:hypothetical protein